MIMIRCRRKGGAEGAKKLFAVTVQKSSDSELRILLRISDIINCDQLYIGRLMENFTGSEKTQKQIL